METSADRATGPHRWSFEQYGEFLHTIPDGAMLVDRTGTILFANRQVEVLLGYSPGELVGQPVGALIPGAHWVEYRHISSGESFPEAGQSTTRAALQARHRDGHSLSVDVVLARRESATLYMMRGMPVRQAPENRPRQREERYQALVECASEAFYEVELGEDPTQRRVTYVSPQMRVLTGHAPETFLHERSVWALVAGPSDLARLDRVTAEMVRTGTAQIRHFRLYDAGSDSHRWIEDRIMPWLDDHGRLAGYQGVVRDITDRWWQQRRMQAIAAVAKVLRECTTRDGLVGGLVSGVLEPVEANGAAFATVDEAERQVVFEAGRGVLTVWTGRRVPWAASVSASVVTTGVPWVTNRAQEDKRMTPGPGGLPAGVTAYASIPLSTKDRAVGALVVTKASPFADQEVEALMAIGEMAAAVLQRQVLHDRLEETCEHTIEGWARALDLRDSITEGHTRRVTEMTVRLAERLGVPPEELPHIRRGAMLHDIGKMGVPDRILRKPGPLTDDEQVVMRRHVELGYAMLAPIEFLRPALDIVRCHHERCDGGGYPRGLKGPEIPLPARIFAVADVYDAMTNDRPYQTAQSHAKAVAFICSQSGRHFDPRVVDAFCTLGPPSGPGTCPVSEEAMPGVSR